MISMVREDDAFSPDGFSERWKSISWALNWIALALLLVCLGILVYFVQLANASTLVMELYRTPVTVTNPNKEIEQGQPLIYAIEYCKYVDIVPTMSRELVAADGRDLKIMLPLTSGSLEMGCHQTHLVEAIPNWVPSGTYRLRIARVYPSRTHVDRPTVFETEPFAVR